jgi:glycosyltransferase involved in cell wall biosynthesis
LAAQYTFGKRAYKKGKVDILHNGVDLSVYHFDANGRENIRREFNLADNAIVVGHVGRLMEQKNHRFLVEVFAKIHEKNPNTVLLLVGKGPLENQLREQIENLGLTNAVIFAGVRKDVPQLLSAMDVFVFPSFYEGMPNTVIEAQATGLPCVIADTITREADITGLVDYLSLGDSAEQWADMALSKVQAQRKDTKEDFIKNKYDIQNVAEQFVSLVFNEK